MKLKTKLIIIISIILAIAITTTTITIVVTNNHKQEQKDDDSNNNSNGNNENEKDNDNENNNGENNNQRENLNPSPSPEPNPNPEPEPNPDPEPTPEPEAKTNIDVSNVVFANASYTYDGEAKGITPLNIPNELSYEIIYKLNGEIIQSPINAGSYTATLSFIVNEPDKYNKPNDLSANLVVNKKELTINDLNIQNEYIYDKANKSITITNLPNNLELDAKYYDQFNNEVNPSASGKYKVIFSLNQNGSNYQLNDEYECYLNIYSNLEYELIDDYYSIKSFKEGFNENILYIPDETENKPIRAISPNSFKNDDSLYEVILSNNIITIGNYSFDNCSNLMSIKLGSNLTALNNSFNNCYRLKEIYNLSNLNIDSLNISKYALDINNSLDTKSKIIYGNDDYIYYLSSNDLSIINYIGESKSITLKSSYDSKEIKNIADYALYDLKLNQLIINSGIKKIGKYAFGGNDFDNLTLPNTCEILDDYALSNCKELSSITLQSSITSLGTGLFLNCEKLSAINLNVLTINKLNDELFKGCSNLATLTLPASVTEIGKNTFAGTSKLEVIDISHITKFNDYSFAEAGIKNITLPAAITIINEHLFDSSKLESITISSTITTIKAKAFLNCRDLSTVTIQNGIASIEKEAFENCSILEEISIPNTLTSLGAGAFSGCGLLENVTLSNQLTKLEANVFEGTKINNITIPSSVTEIGNAAFYECKELLKITIPASVEAIGTNVFDGCKKLAMVEIQGNITKLPQFIFNDCIALDYVIVPASMISIEEYAINNSETKICVSAATGNITIKDNNLITADNIYYYSNDYNSETSPGNYWGYDGDEIKTRIV